MAEATHAVEPSLVEGDYFDLNVTNARFQIAFEERGTLIFIPRFSEVVRGFIRSFKGAITKMKVAFAPLPLPLVGLSVGAFVFAALNSQDNHWWKSTRLAAFLWKIDSHYLSKYTRHFSTTFKITNLALLTAGVSIYTFAAVQRFILRRLLEYHGFLSERGKASIWTKIWYFLLNYLFIHRIHETLYAYQPCLPALPLPPLRQTCDKYFESIEPLMDEKEKIEHKEEMNTFLQTTGPKLQRLCMLQRLTSENWIADWWLQAIYLRSREPTMIGSNYFGITLHNYVPTTNQLVRASVVAFILGELQRDIENGTFEPQLVRGVVPLCMAQYASVFGVTRVPHKTCDKLVKHDFSDSRFFVVYNKGTMWKVPLYCTEKSRQYTPLELFSAMSTIAGYDAATTQQHIDADPARQIPVLTTMNRDHWAETREAEFVRDPQNKRMLSIVESAAFFLCLDETDEPEDVNAVARKLFFGNKGANRWCDKSCNWVVLKGGRTGIHAEHSWGDASTVAHINEVVALRELAREHYNLDGSLKKLPADEASSASSGNNHPTCAPVRLQFNVRSSLAKIIAEAKVDINKSIDDCVVRLNRFGKFGKNLLSKQLQCGPDSAIQMALQLAYYRDQGHFDLTYESAMTRFFKLGRTETIRSLSKESVAFVEAFEQKEQQQEEGEKKVVVLSDEEQYDLFMKACDVHQTFSHEAMCGQAVDRHLFGLYVVSIVRGIESSFLKNAMTKRKWTLSTSQIPPRQCTDALYDPIPAENKTQHALESPNGGFMSVSPVGYGVCYMVRDDFIWFTCSAFKKAENTDADRMYKRIEVALEDIKDRFLPIAQKRKAEKEAAKKKK